jgi:hypothetical protein
MMAEQEDWPEITGSRFTPTLYDTDYVRWVDEQVAALRDRRWEDLDPDNLAEEVESLSRSDRRELRSRIEVIVQHLLKAQYTGTAPAGWSITIATQRDAIRRLLEESPSLRREMERAIWLAYPAARQRASFELDVPEDVLPASCPFGMEQILDV